MITLLTKNGIEEYIEQHELQHKQIINQEDREQKPAYKRKKTAINQRDLLKNQGFWLIPKHEKVLIRSLLTISED